MTLKSTHLSDHETSITDESLWKSFRQGDRDAYQKLYSRHLSDLYNYGNKILPNRSVVTDQIQELFIDLWKYKESVAEVQNIKSYLFRALRNRIVKEVSRNRYIVSDVEQEYANTQIVLPFENRIIELQTQSHKSKRLQTAFHALSKRQREVINLLFYEEFSYEEVANIMSINLRSVYTLAWKALSILRRELSGFILAVLIYQLITLSP